MMNENTHNDLPVYLYRQGMNDQAQEYFGCHVDQKTECAVFRVWAPDALEVSVVGDWNGWSDNADPMEPIPGGGGWEVSVENVHLWQCYKYSILGDDGERKLKADPFAFHAETEGGTASIVCDIKGYEWRDEHWMRKRRSEGLYHKPVNIYEVHPGSWRRRLDGRPLSYLELADQLVPYLREMGYTHLELLSVMEHTSGRSGGYRISGYFAATSRYGTPRDLMTLIDRCHETGIGVILDWGPTLFPSGAHGLDELNGALLSDTQEAQTAEQREWGARYFDYSRAEVHSFLISSALFWLEAYHVDGLRVDGMNSILYLDFGKKQGEWTPNRDGGNENLEAAAFLQKLNNAVAGKWPGVFMIAEGPLSWPMATKPAREGGLGFHFVWNTRWTGDILDYISVDPFYRKLVHDKITLSFYSAFSERFILPIHHNEVVSGKRSILDKMPGEYDWKFAGVRAFLGYMVAHPGKKLHFMGVEIGEFNEWDGKSTVGWSLLDYPAHRQLQKYVGALNRFYLETPALWEIDNSWDGFRWISADDKEQNIVVFMRMDQNDSALIVLQNFAPVKRENYCFGVPEEGVYEEVFNSDRIEYGGWGNENGTLQTEATPMHGLICRLKVTVPPLSTVFFRRQI